MSLLSIASNASRWRGYDYFKAKKVLSWEQTGDFEFLGTVAGSAQEPYCVIINVQHPQKSSCNCPLAAGRRIICKHKIALFFSVFPDEAEQYIEEIKEAERAEEQEEQEKERLEQENYQMIVKHVKSLTKEELQIELINALLEAEERDSFRY